MHKFSFLPTFFFLTLFLMPLAGCANSSETDKQTKIAAKAGISEAWIPLRNKLVADNVTSPELDTFFAQLSDEITQDPMGRKVTELYTNAYAKKIEHTKNPNYDQPTKEFKTPGPWYRNVVTDKNALLCIEFLKTYSAAFEKAHKTYGVPPEIAVSLLFVETRLGNYLGKENAFYTLASMASSKDISQIPDWIEPLPDMTPEREEWINNIMDARSEWAYKEFKALVEHVLENKLDPFQMPGSIYGAIGYCQFMPSNLVMYTADGNDDGIINLFDPEDAIMSLAKYLKFYKWDSNASIAKKQATLRKYNNLTVYANTILALGEKVNMMKK